MFQIFHRQLNTMLPISGLFFDSKNKILLLLNCSFLHAMLLVDKLSLQLNKLRIVSQPSTHLGSHF